MADEKKTEIWLPKTITRPVKKGVPKFRLPEGLIIAALSAIAYLLVYVYESSYAEVFGIPSEFITFNLTRVFIVIFALLSVVGAVLWIANALVMLLPTTPNPIAKRLRRISPAILFVVGLVYIYRHDWNLALMAAASGLAMPILFEFAFPLVTQRGKGSYLEKLEADQQQRERRRRKGEEVETLLDKGAQILGWEVILILIYLWFGLLLTYGAGRSAARNQRKFLITNTSPEMVVLRIYGDKMVCAPLSRSTGEVERRFVVLKVAEDPDLMLGLEEVGPLRLGEATSRPMHSPIPTPTLPLTPTMTLSPTPP
jgi:hypothetical protein